MNPVTRSENRIGSFLTPKPEISMLKNFKKKSDCPDITSVNSIVKLNATTGLMLIGKIL